MKDSRFEIVRRPNDRYAWLLVVTDESRPRVLARSTRDYRSPAKAEQAIDRMRDAPVEQNGPDPQPFPLPATSFRIVSGVLPLMVEEVPADYDSSSLTTGQAVKARPTAKPKPKARPKRSPAKKAKSRGRRAT